MSLLVMPTKQRLATLQLTAVKGLSGEVVYTGLEWRLTPKNTQQAVETSFEARPRWQLEPGIYRIQLYHENKLHDYDELTLQAFTAIDLVVLLQETALSTEVTEITEYLRREAEREAARELGPIQGYLKDPYLNQQTQAGELSSIAASGAAVHPILGQAVQFTNNDSNSQPLPSENDEAQAHRNQLELNLQQELDQQLVNRTTPTLSPYK